MEPTQTPAPNGAAPNAGGDADADIITGMAKVRAESGTADAPSKPPAAEPDGDTDAPAESGDAEEKPEADKADPDFDAEPDEPAAAADESPEADPKLAKNLEAITRAEKRSKEAVARERREVEQLRATLEKDWAPRVEKVQRFEQLEQRAKYDPAGVLEALGIDLQSDGELIARQVYSRSKAAASNPQTREAAERALREREQASTVGQLQKQLDEMRGQLEQRDRQATIARDVEKYVAGFEKAVSDDAPLLKTYLSNDRDEALDALASLAAEIAEDTGERPDHTDVVKEFEKRRRAQLKKLGIDAPAPKGATKKTPQTAGETRAAKTLTNDLGSTTKPRSAPLSPEEEREDILKGMRELREAVSD